MEDRTIRKERSQNIWSSFGRKFEAVAQATSLDPMPEVDLASIGGLAGAKEEIQTYACARHQPRRLPAVGHRSSRPESC